MDPWFRDRPDLLFALAAAFARGTERAWNPAAAAPDADPADQEAWEEGADPFRVFQLLMDADEHRWGIFLRDLAGYYPPPGAPVQEEDARRRLQRVLLAHTRRQATLARVLVEVVRATLDPAGPRRRALDSMRKNILAALEREYPDLVRLTVPGADRPLAIAELPSHLAELHRAARAAQRGTGAAPAAPASRGRADSPPSPPPDATAAAAATAEIHRLSAELAAAQRAARLAAAAEADQRSRAERAEAAHAQLLHQHLAADDDAPGAPTRQLAGLRILLVGGEEGTLPALRAAVESRGATLIHEDRSARTAASRTSSVDLVVVKTRSLSHNVYETVRSAAAQAGVPILHWLGRSPETLMATLLQLPERAGDPS
ncbi:MAG: DUF2325 domain-containing protein [Gemmatimonadota bacterium]